jgi:hypothetical protein
MKPTLTSYQLIFTGLITIVALLISSSAMANDITFNSQPPAEYIPDQTFADSGFTFTSQGSGPDFILLFAGDPIHYVFNGTVYLFDANDGYFTMAPTGGGEFSLASFDGAGTFLEGPNALEIQVTGFLSGGGLRDSGFFAL